MSQTQATFRISISRDNWQRQLSIIIIPKKTVLKGFQSLQETILPDSVLNKVPGFRPVTYQKENPALVLFDEFFEIFGKVFL